MCLGCGGKNGSDDATTATQTDTGATSTPETTSTAASSSTSTPTTTADGTTEPTTGGADKGLFCQAACKVDTDCLVIGDDFFFECKDGICVDTGCVTDADCVVTQSFWYKKCAAQADCSGAACIDTGGGVGRCAQTPDAGNVCADFGQAEAMYPPIEGGAPVVVCVELDYECRDGACFDPCETDDDCTLMPQCDKATGECVCTSDADCESGSDIGMSVCLDGRCGCASDADCKGAELDRCYAGTCGCSSAAACPPSEFFDNTTVVCQ